MGILEIVVRERVAAGEVGISNWERTRGLKCHGGSIDGSPKKNPGADPPNVGMNDLGKKKKNAHVLPTTCPLSIAIRRDKRGRRRTNLGLGFSLTRERGGNIKK